MKFLSHPVAGPLAAALLTATALSATPAQAARLHGDYATRLRGLGFTMTLGPVFDVGSGSGLGDRTFGTDVDTVVRYALPVAQAVRSAGLIPVAKHWPGIGRGTADPHTARSDVGSIDRLRSSDLVAFDRAIEGDVPAVMVSHVVVDGLTDGLPASTTWEVASASFAMRARHSRTSGSGPWGMGSPAPWSVIASRVRAATPR